MESDRKTGLAFSGGGVRSAAFCSGVLRRMLQKSVPVDYLSCVSGGGYTGSAYLDWKYRNEQKDDPAWHAEFFDNMRRHPNPFCNCENPIRAIFDSIVLVGLMFFVTLILPWLTGFSYAIPTAYFINFFFGKILRAPFTCPNLNTHNFTKAQEKENPDTLKFLKLENSTRSAECVPDFGPRMYSTLILFASLVTAFLVLYFLSGMVKRRCKAFVRFFSNIAGFLLAMTVLPWFIEQYIVVTPLWANFLIIIFSIFLWLGFPPLRSKASIALIIYTFAYAVKWRVYGTPILGFGFTFLRFWVLMWISGVFIWMNPLLGLLQQNLVHMYNRWRLQKSFYSPESNSGIGCSGITCRDFFPLCCKPDRERLDRPVTMGDLADVMPQYICNVTVHHWRRLPRADERNYELLTISPTVIERIDRGRNEEEFEGSAYINPSDVKLSTAMATSAAVVAYDLGTAGDMNVGFRDLQVILGLGLGKRLITHAQNNDNCFVRFLPFLVQFLVALPIVALPVIQVYKGGDIYDEVAVAMFLVFIGLLTFVAILPTGQKDPGCIERFVRWCIVHIYHVRFIREMMGITNRGPRPPPVVSLSDGGHRDNLGLLALLKLRLPRIVVVNGGFPPDGDKFDVDLLLTLSMAREKLRCSFIGMNRRDITEDIRINFIEKPPGKRPRSYKFRVEYYEKEGLYGEERKVGDGVIILLSPRHPSDGMAPSSDAQQRWSECLDDVKVVLEEPSWGAGPVVEETEADRLTGCCCDCCHEKPCTYLLDDVCGVFPVHSTANQLFTPQLFSAYHREGYHACVEARADEFLAGMEDV